MTPGKDNTNSQREKRGENIEKSFSFFVASDSEAFRFSFFVASDSEAFRRSRSDRFVASDSEAFRFSSFVFRLSLKCSIFVV